VSCAAANLPTKTGDVILAFKREPYYGKSTSIRTRKVRVPVYCNDRNPRVGYVNK
jgi:hypothetical protein